MRKTFEELTDSICWFTYLVGLKESEQDDNTPDEECYWLNLRQVKELLRLVREKTLEECAEVTNHYSLEDLPKDSIKI